MRFGIGLSVQHRPDDSQVARFAEPALPLRALHLLSADPDARARGGEPVAYHGKATRRTLGRPASGAVPLIRECYVAPDTKTALAEAQTPARALDHPRTGVVY